MALRKQEINPQREELKQKFVDKLQLDCSVSPDEAIEVHFEGNVQEY